MRAKNILYLILCCITFTAKATHPSIPYITSSIKELIRDGKMDYETTLKMPDGTTVKCNGMMAFKGPNFYDSSNNRFIFYNNYWYIGADHTDKTIKIYNMKAWKKEFGQFGQLDLFGYLMENDSTLFDNAKYSMENLPNDIYYIHIVFTSSSSLIKKLDIKYSLGSKIPIEYSGQVVSPYTFKKVPIKGTGENTLEPSSYTTLEFSCKNITRANAQLFNHERLIQESSREAKLLRFKDYKTFYSNKTKN